MQEQRTESKDAKKLKITSTGCCSRVSCCQFNTNCKKISQSSSRDDPLAETSSSDRYPSVSTLSHYLVQEKLAQMIKKSEEEREKRLSEARKEKQKTIRSCRIGPESRRLVMMVATEKCTRDPRGDFRQSMVEVIMNNRIDNVKDLRYLLRCYLEMNSQECRGVILEAFHQVCSDIFLGFKCQYR